MEVAKDDTNFTGRKENGLELRDLEFAEQNNKM